MRISAVVTAAAIALSFGVVSASPDRTNQAQPGQSAATESASENKLNIEGCVFPKRALASKEPVAALPTGTEDYVLTDTTVISSSPGLEKVGGRVFKLDGVGADRLRDLTGKRAGVNGRADLKPDPPALQVISILETVGLCPPVPTTATPQS